MPRAASIVTADRTQQNESKAWPSNFQDEVKGYGSNQARLNRLLYLAYFKEVLDTLNLM